ncbi:MAG: hypothetical protein MI749_08495 [Desulfovibrionales bacterium]|nr:hypothetical protein [Desulfovibrionales bacterium]
MLVVHKKEFTIGFLMTIGFVAVLIVMFSPISGGKNAFELSDELFNSISKGSTYHIEHLQEQVETTSFASMNVYLDMKTPELAQQAATILNNSAHVAVEGSRIHVQGALQAILDQALTDSDQMFYNHDAELSAAYGISGKKALFIWWNVLTKAEKELKQQAFFTEAKAVHSVITKGVEVGYNYFGIVPERASDAAGVLSASLIFYVAYTLWWGFAIFFLVEGMGLSIGGKVKP